MAFGWGSICGAKCVLSWTNALRELRPQWPFSDRRSRARGRASGCESAAEKPCLGCAKSAGCSAPGRGRAAAGVLRRAVHAARWRSAECAARSPISSGRSERTAARRSARLRSAGPAAASAERPECRPVLRAAAAGLRATRSAGVRASAASGAASHRAPHFALARSARGLVHSFWQRLGPWHAG